MELLIANYIFFFHPLPAEERALYTYVTKLRLIIGESIGFACHTCDHRLSSIRDSDECAECAQQYLGYWLRPNEYPVNRDGNIVIPIVDLIEESTDVDSD